MGVIMIKCPGTGQAIPTGMKVDRERFRSSPVFFARTFSRSARPITNGLPGGLVHEPEEKWRMREAAFALQSA